MPAHPSRRVHNDVQEDLTSDSTAARASVLTRLPRRTCGVIEATMRDSPFPTVGKGRSGHATLISAAPILALLKDIRSQAEILTHWSPSSDVGTAMQRVGDLLERALGEARRADVWLRVDQVEALTGRPQ